MLLQLDYTPHDVMAMKMKEVVSTEMKKDSAVIPGLTGVDSTTTTMRTTTIPTTIATSKIYVTEGT